MNRRSTGASRMPASARSPWSHCCSRKPLPASPIQRSFPQPSDRGRSPVAPESLRAEESATAGDSLAPGAVARRETTDDLDALLSALPPEIVAAIHRLPEVEGVIEVDMDLGRRPEARFPDAEVTLLDREVNEADLGYVVDHIGTFGDDN